MSNIFYAVKLGRESERLGTKATKPDDILTQERTVYILYMPQKRSTTYSGRTFRLYPVCQYGTHKYLRCYTTTLSRIGVRNLVLFMPPIYICLINIHPCLFGSQDVHVDEHLRRNCR